MNDMQHFITAKQAAAILKVSERQVHHYGTSGKIRTTRAGRRLLYNPDDVERLAQELRVDIKPVIVRKDDVNEQLARYIVERQETDRQVVETQRDLQQGQREMREELAQIRARLEQPQPKPRGPSWQLVLALAIVLAIVVLAVAVAFRLF